jgi:hypothetical protein
LAGGKTAAQNAADLSPNCVNKIVDEETKSQMMKG